MPTVDSTIWADKHRPDTLDEVRGNEQTVDLLKQWVEDNSVPNLLFAGPAGTGKTASAVAFAKDKFGDAWQDHFLQLNASDDRGIDVVRNEIKQFARLSTVSDYQFKLIFLDESDSLCLPPGTEVVTGYPSSPEVKPIEEVAKNSEPIPSVDFETNELQSDRGKMLETGTAEFYDVEFADGREVTASTHHPFFVVGENEELQEIKVQDLSSGDGVADFRDEIGVVECEVCDDMICHDSRERFIEVGWEENENRPDPQFVSDGGRRVVDTVEVESVEFSHVGKAYNITMEGTPNFMLANGLLTHNTRDAQPALRRIMEDYSDRTRFVLSCNFPSQIIDPIQSRCSVLRFEPLADTQMEDMIREVLLKEDVDAKHDQIETIIEHANGDARTAMHTLQSAVIDGEVQDGAISALTAFPDEEEVRELLNMAVQGDDGCMSRVDEMLNNGVDVSLLLEQFADVVRETDELPADARMKMLDKIGECEYRVTHGSNPRVQMHSLMADMRVARHLSLEPYQRQHGGTGKNV